MAIVTATTGQYTGQVEQVLTAEEILRLQELVRRVPVSEQLVRYAVELVRGHPAP